MIIVFIGSATIAPLLVDPTFVVNSGLKINTIQAVLASGKATHPVSNEVTQWVHQMGSQKRLTQWILKNSPRI